jgi:hypothetical protein
MIKLERGLPYSNHTLANRPGLNRTDIRQIMDHIPSVPCYR